MSSVELELEDWVTLNNPEDYPWLKIIVFPINVFFQKYLIEH